MIIGARSARDAVGLALVGLRVDTHHNRERIVLGLRREDNDVSLGGLGNEENTGRLAEELSAGLAPSNVLRVAGAGGDKRAGR